MKKKFIPGQEEIEEFARKLQQQILENARSVYSDKTLDHWMNPRNFRSMDHPDGYAKVKGSCGDTMEMFLRVDGGIIRDCSFVTDGCGSTIACGSAATEIAKEKSLPDAIGLVSANEILKKLGGLPEDSIHCARLASETLRKALADYLYHERSAWKRAYRKT